jgi:hypothetical protein
MQKIPIPDLWIGKERKTRHFPKDFMVWAHKCGGDMTPSPQGVCMVTFNTVESLYGWGGLLEISKNAENYPQSTEIANFTLFFTL